MGCGLAHFGRRGQFRWFLDPSDQNELYHIPSYTKIWDLSKEKKLRTIPLTWQRGGECCKGKGLLKELGSAKSGGRGTQYVTQRSGWYTRGHIRMLHTVSDPLLFVPRCRPTLTWNGQNCQKYSPPAELFNHLCLWPWSNLLWSAMFVWAVGLRPF